MSNDILARVAQAKAAAEERLSRSGGGGPRTMFWKPKNGANNIRVMPAWTDSVEDFKFQFWREIAQHWNVSEEQKAPITCPRKTPGLTGDCPICEFIDTVKNDQDPKAVQLVRDVRAKVTFLFNIVDMKDPVYTAADVAEWTRDRPDNECPYEVGSPKIQVYAAPLTVYDAILGIINTSRQNITDLNTGRTISIHRFGNKDPRLTRYQVTPHLEAERFDLKGAELPQLHQHGALLDYSDIKKALDSGVGSKATSMVLGSGAKAAAALPAATARKARSEEADLAADLWSVLDNS